MGEREEAGRKEGRKEVEEEEEKEQRQRGFCFSSPGAEVDGWMDGWDVPFQGDERNSAGESRRSFASGLRNGPARCVGGAAVLQNRALLLDFTAKRLFFSCDRIC